MLTGTLCWSQGLCQGSEQGSLLAGSEPSQHIASRPPGHQQPPWPQPPAAPREGQGLGAAHPHRWFSLLFLSPSCLLLFCLQGSEISSSNSSSISRQSQLTPRSRYHQHLCFQQVLVLPFFRDWLLPRGREINGLLIESFA